VVCLDVCPNCCSFMIKGNHEWFCTKCGHVEDDYIQFTRNGFTNTKSYSGWRNNFQQTKDQFEINNGRILICERFNGVKRR